MALFLKGLKETERLEWKKKDLHRKKFWLGRISSLETKYVAGLIKVIKNIKDQLLYIFSETRT